MAKTIAILGVTGNQGGSVASTFLSLGWQVRGITRSATSPAALDLKARGITLIEADQDDSASLVKAFSGAHVIFAMTDFWAAFSESYGKLSKVSDRAAGEHAREIEVTRGKKLVDAAAKVLADEAVLERFVLSTLPGFKDVSGGKYTFAYHFDGKADISAYLKGKETLWAKSSLLNMGFYMTNLVKSGTMVGFTKKYVMRKPGKNTAIHPFVNTRDTGAFVELLVNSPPCQDLLGVSEMGSYNTFMELLTEVSGKSCISQEISVEDADKALPGGLGREVGESTATSAEFGWGKHLVMPKDLNPDIKLTSLRKYIEGENWTDLFNKM
ncbi:hypothetical protein D0Z07_1192 [Hyphodiscus hymeniophilus]|uniref:NmrA-like domain-containing protein n=1 Tax=Hyphodiscus hymeniophilus TaxID=353542 RepID=A0A9P7B0D6_9HELO|nr:hypothetical protein D0Z07_1192 [Hyphodiscus hymeniophilus]